MVVFLVILGFLGAAGLIMGVTSMVLWSAGDNPLVHQLLFDRAKQGMPVLTYPVFIFTPFYILGLALAAPFCAKIQTKPFKVYVKYKKSEKVKASSRATTNF
jgi:hypothetical protein